MPLKLNNKLRDLSKVDRGKILSISRLERIKLHILPIIDSIEELHNEGHKFEFYIFGQGHLEKYIENYIAEKNAGKYVFMMGKLEYDQIYRYWKMHLCL